MCFVFFFGFVSEEYLYLQVCSQVFDEIIFQAGGGVGHQSKRWG